jgi:hypothetical protein
MKTYKYKGAEYIAKSFCGHTTKCIKCDLYNECGWENMPLSELCNMMEKDYSNDHFFKLFTKCVDHVEEKTFPWNI